jgi:hypothetical protein
MKNNNINMKDNIEIGFSPCPNDTFIFDALVNKKIDTEGIAIQCRAGRCADAESNGRSKKSRR